MLYFVYILKKYDSVIETSSKYGKIFKLLITDSLWRYKGETIQIVLAGSLGVFFQAQAIGLAVYYAQTLEKGEAITMLGRSFELRSSEINLFLCGIAVLLSLLISTWLIYFFDMRSLKLNRMYEEFCSKRILSLSGINLRFGTNSENGIIDDKHLLRLARSDSRCCGYVLRLILNGVAPAITFIVATAVLFYINPFLSLLMLVMMGISLSFQYKISIYGAKNSSLMEKNATQAAYEYQRIIYQQKWVAASLPEHESWLEKVFTSTIVKEYIDAYIGRLRAPRSSQFVSNILFAVAIFTIFLTLGLSILTEGKGWGRLIIYLIALRYVLVNLKQLSKNITSINRFYPQIRRYFQFIQNTETQSIDGEKLLESYTVVVGGNPIDGSLEHYDLSKGSCVGLISPVALNRYTLAFLTDSLLGKSSDAARTALGSMWFVSSQFGCLPGQPLRELLGFPPGYKWQELINEMKGTGLECKLIEKLPHSLEKPVSPDTWNQVDSDLKYSLALLRTCHSDCQWIMLEETGLRSLSDVTRQYFLKRLSDRILVIIYDKDIKTVGNYNEDVISLIDETGVRALGDIDWFKENHNKVKETANMKYKKVYTGVDNEIDIDIDGI